MMASTIKNYLAIRVMIERVIGPTIRFNDTTQQKLEVILKRKCYVSNSIENINGTIGTINASAVLLPISTSFWYMKNI